MIVAILAAYVVVVILGAMLLIRNEQVSAYRDKLIDDISAAANWDIDRGLDWRWRYDAYRAVSYDRMVLQFWRPLDSFYPDQSFRDRKAARP